MLNLKEEIAKQIQIVLVAMKQAIEENDAGSHNKYTSSLETLVYLDREL